MLGGGAEVILCTVTSGQAMGAVQGGLGPRGTLLIVGVPDARTYRGRVQAHAEHFPVRGVEPGEVQAEAADAVLPDLHRGEMAVAGRRDGAEPFHRGGHAVDLQAHRNRASCHPTYANRLATRAAQTRP